jgi:hypothetical protein
MAASFTEMAVRKQGKTKGGVRSLTVGLGAVR